MPVCMSFGGKCNTITHVTLFLKNPGRQLKTNPLEPGKKVRNPAHLEVRGEH